LPLALLLRTCRRLVQELASTLPKGVCIIALRPFLAGPPRPNDGGRHGDPKAIRRGPGRSARIDHAIPRTWLKARALVAPDARWADCLLGPGRANSGPQVLARNRT
jgi:hypothetical protein